MSHKIKLDLIIEEMDGQSEEMSAFYNKETKEITFISEESLRMAENEVSIQTLPNWLQESIKIAEEILYEDIWIPLPSKFEINEYDMMEEFCLSIRNDILSDIMNYSIRGRGAFRRFKENIKRYNMEDEWYKFKNEAMKIIAIEWCEGNNIDYEN